MESSIPGKVEGEGSLTNRGTSCEDYEVSILPAISYPIQAWKSSGHSGNIFILMAEVFNPLDGFHQNPVNRIEILPKMIVRYFEQLAFRIIQQVKHISAVFVGITDDFTANAY